MINYSIVMRSVNANLFEINQAKSRIKAAEAAGQTPNADDVALVATEKQNAFAIAQYADVMTIEKFARHIATHGCVYSRADISAILYMAVDCMREQLLEGKKIRLGDLGDFSVNLSSKGAEAADKFSAQNITGISVVWDAGSEFKNLIADAEFNLVASRSAQAAVLKAIKAGSTTVDLAAGNDGGDGGDGGSTPSGGNSGGNTSTTKYTLSLAASPTAGGSVSGAGQYNSGASASINAVANSGYTFTRWSDGVTSASRSVVMTGNKTLSAIFTATDAGEVVNPGGDEGEENNLH